ncbi:MAG: recombinase family protein [[Ruminococcus] torques]
MVRDIFRKRLDGYSALHIADELNRLGVLSPLAYKRNNGLPHAKGGYTDRKDCKWSATTIIRILQDETYTGTLVQGKQTTPHFKLKEREDKPSRNGTGKRRTRGHYTASMILTWCSNPKD